MIMAGSKLTKDFNFKNPAIYKIVVMGVIERSASDNFSGMQITVERKKKNETTSLVGEIRDQAALSGILNTLYEMHMSVISVNVLSDVDN